MSAETMKPIKDRTDEELAAVIAERLMGWDDCFAANMSSWRRDWDPADNLNHTQQAELELVERENLTRFIEILGGFDKGSLEINVHPTSILEMYATATARQRAEAMVALIEELGL